MKKLKTLIAIYIILLSGLILVSCNKTDDNKTTTKTDSVNSTQKPQDELSKESEQKIQSDDMTKMESEANKNSNLVHTMVKIPSAQCEQCKSNLTKALKKVKGITNFTVDIDNSVIHINYDKNLTDISKIENTITSAGYDANNKKADPEAYSKLDECCKKPEDRK